MGVGELEHGIVRDVGREIGDVNDVVPVGPQAGDDGRIDTLVGEAPHATDLETG